MMGADSGSAGPCHIWILFVRPLSGSPDSASGARRKNKKKTTFVCSPTNLHLETQLWELHLPFHAHEDRFG